MSRTRCFARILRPLARPLLSVPRYVNLMRALEWRLVAPWVRRVKGLYILDVGCGHGLYSLDLARRGATLFGCDLQDQALAKAQRVASRLGLGEQALFLVANGEALPLPDNQYDLVVCNCTLEHIADDRAALAAMARSLRPAGILYLSVDNAEHDLALDFVERLPSRLRSRLLLPEILATPSLSASLDSRLDRLYAVRRRYRCEDLVAMVSAVGLSVVASRTYLAGVGAAHFEAFHALRGLNAGTLAGRLLYMISSVILYPFAAWADSRPGARGHGLVVVARKEAGGGV